MLTLFAIPKPFHGHIGVIQRNALESWARLSPRPQVVLFGNEDGTAEVARELGVEHVPEIACNEFGTPLLHDVLAQAERRAEHDTLCYVNADIILMGDFMEALRQTRHGLTRFLLASRRWNYDLTEPLDFAPGWENRLRRDVRQRGELFLTGAIDYFCFPRGLWGEVPPFAIGRTVWDNWLLWKARARGAALVDATPSVMAVHQNHHYGHHASGRAGVFDGTEARRNFALTGGEHHHYTLNVATHLVTAQGLERRRPGRWLLERAQTRWTGDSRRALRGLERAARPTSYFGFPARGLLRLIYASTPARQRLGRALTAWRDSHHDSS